MRCYYIFLFFIFFCCQSKNIESVEAKPLEITNEELFNYIEYCNDRFNFCFSYPSHFSAQPSSANGDGKTFINKLDDAKIIAFGELDYDNAGLEPHLHFIQDQIKIQDSARVPYGYNFIGFGKNDGKIYHERILIKEKENANSKVNVIYSIQLSYPQKHQKKYTQLWANLMGNLKI
ncbi:hypothetical protein [Candidatus Ornithobacterium hominis]|uniref:hypothetical protein n=1 Tax=Candidatus Ornithobacterium hominis TaxID=2497989 RepID=UPI0024BD38DC|nr:hypothetical protein [Candidatus Ornithobacterium hominis]